MTPASTAATRPPLSARNVAKTLLLSAGRMWPGRRT
jgi:hypothetical protein